MHGRRQQHDRQRAGPAPRSPRCAREHGALLYVDDAHGFGVIGERARRDHARTATRGNSVVRHAGETYDNLVLVGGFSKAYSSLLAFIACPTEVKDLLKVAAPPYLYSGPSPVASLATVLAGFDVNERRGDALRARALHGSPRASSTALRRASASHTPNRSGFPIIEIPLRDHGRIDAVGRFLFDRGVYVTLAAYPLVPKHEVGFRVQLTAANTRRRGRHADRRARGARRARRARARASDADGAGGMTSAARRSLRRAAPGSCYLAAGALLVRALPLGAAVRRAAAR